MQLIQNINWETSGKQLGKSPMEVLEFLECVQRLASNQDVSKYLKSDVDMAAEVAKLEKTKKRLETKQDAWEDFKVSPEGEAYLQQLKEAKKKDKVRDETLRTAAVSGAFMTPTPKPGVGGIGADIEAADDTSGGKGKGSSSSSSSSSSSGGGGGGGSGSMPSLEPIVFPDIPDGMNEFTYDDAGTLKTYSARHYAAQKEEEKARTKCGTLKQWVEHRLDAAWLNGVDDILKNGEPAYKQLQDMLKYIRTTGLGDANDLHKQLRSKATGLGDVATKVDTGILLDNLVILRARMDAHAAAVAEQGGGARCPATPPDDFWVDLVEGSINAKTGMEMTTIVVAIQNHRKHTWRVLLEALKEITDRAQAKDAAASGGSGGGVSKPAYGSLANAPPLAMFAAAAAGGDGVDGGADADQHYAFLGVMQDQAQTQDEMDNASSSSSGGGGGGGGTAFAYLATATSGKGAGPCYAFQKNACSRGSACRFQHVKSSEPTQRLPVRTDAGGYDLCYAHQRGACDRGAACRFSHDPAAKTRPADTPAKLKNAARGPGKS